MNNSYGANVVHTENSSVQNQVHSGHPAHSAHNNTLTPPIGSYFNQHTSPVSLPVHQQSAQLQLQTIRAHGNSGTHVATNPPPISAHGVSGFYDPHHVQLTSALEKTFFSTSAIAGLQSAGPRYYSSVGSNVPPAVATNAVQQVSHQHHSHQPGNTILITNNFAAHQYGATAPHAQNASAQIQPCTTTNVAGGVVSPTVTSATSGYNSGTSNNIRIITTMPPNTIHNHHSQQQQLYNLTKEIEPNVRDDIIQLPQFYHAPHQSSAYTQHLPSVIPTHFTQHFAGPSTASASVQITHDEAQPQPQFFMTMPSSNDGNTSSTIANISVPKMMTNTLNEVSTVAEAIPTTSTIVSSATPTTTSNSTLVLDRINICINNHYSDSLSTNNSLPTTLEANTITANSAVPAAVHTFSTTTHAPQQPSPIIPAIHHKVVLEPVGSSGTLQTDSYISNDSTLVIDEPDSTTTTPHTPPTTPENSSPSPTQSNLATTKSVVAPPVMAAHLLVGDKLINDIPSIKPLTTKVVDKTGTSTSDQPFTTITHSIDLLDEDEECDYGNSETENEKDTARDNTPNDINDDSVMEIEDDDVEPTTPETARILSNIKHVDLDTPKVVTNEQEFTALDNSNIETDCNVLKADSPKSPTNANSVTIGADETAPSVTLLTPPTPSTSPTQRTEEGSVQETIKKSTGAPMPEFTFSMGEDVFIRKDDGRQYLGTVIGSSAGGENTMNKIQYLIRFDDSSELWCGIDQMRRLGSSIGNGNAQMCVACKRTQLEDIVEICDDCRRGYHRSCTRETLTGSGIWWCLRCNKPMKDPPQNTDTKQMGKLLSNCKNSYKSYGDILKSSPSSSSSKLKAPVDIYEFHTDNEVFTSDDEIPIKHIMEKARKTHDSTQNNNSNKTKLKSTQKQHKLEETLCAKILVMGDDNANDASLNKIMHSPEKEKDISPNIALQVATAKSATKIEDVERGTATTAAVNAVESNTPSAVYINNKGPSIGTERTSRKRKAFTLSNTYKEVAAEAASKRYDSSRICDSSSDENSSSSRGTSLDVIIPAPKNFLGLNNPFLMVTPKKSSPTSHASGGTGGCVQGLFSFSRSGTMIKNSIFNTTALDFSSKLAALKSAGIFPNLSASNLVKAAGQPRTVRTIKRRLSAKDITIGPNQEVRRRRTRRLSSNVEVISTTTFNTIPANFFPIHAKDLLSKHTHLNAHSTGKTMSSHSKQKKQSALQQQQTASTCISSLSSASSTASPPDSVASSVDSHAAVLPIIKPSHGRRLRQRPQKSSPANSRRSSVSSVSTASNNSSRNITLATLQQQQQELHKNGNVNKEGTSIQDLKQSVKEYFGGVINRIESGEQFCIRAKRHLANGQMQYLIEWGDANVVPTQSQTTWPVIISSSTPTATECE